MNDFDYIYHSLKSRWINCLLSTLLTAFGLSIAILITQFTDNVQNRINNDGKGIDIVIGAKGSPLQIVLSSIYHIDVPTGNIPLEEVEKFITHPQVEQAIPLALGDSWKGKRIVGTTKNYLNHYEAKIQKGRTWDEEYEVVIGSSINLRLNDEFIGSHGLFDGGKDHDEHKYKVVGILKSTGTVLDNLILTDLNSVLEMHHHKKVDLNNFENLKLKNNDNLKKNDSHNQHHHNDHDESESNTHDIHDHESRESKVHNEHSHQGNEDTIENKHSSEITALLITTKTPIANINLPLKINKETLMQAANPAKEITRLSSMLGIGSKSLNILSVILICFAALSVFSGLAANLENRMGDLSILRAIGYSKKRIFKLICFEGIFIALIGVIIGIVISLIIFYLMVFIFNTLSVVQVSFMLSTKIFYISIIVVFAGFVAALFPVYTFSKISVANQLTRNT